MTLEMLLNNVSSYELTEWMAFFRLENEDMEKAKLQAKSVQGASKPKWLRG